jgi:hypothetical protein
MDTYNDVYLICKEEIMTRTREVFMREGGEFV